MRVLLISANTEQINMPTLPLGLASVAMATRNAGHKVELLDLMSKEDVQTLIREAVEGFSPDVVGISVRNIDDQNMDNPSFLLEQVKRVVEICRIFADVPIVLGGAGYSMYPDSALAYLEADMGIQGEGEVAFTNLLDRMQKGADLAETPGLFLPGRSPRTKRAFAQNLDEFPFPEDHLWLTSSAVEDEDFWLPLQTRRGCPMNCSYCATATIEGKIFRKRSPALVVKEVARQAKKGFQRFHFVDNTFNLPAAYAKELCRQLAEANLDIAWRCILYPWNLDEEMVRLMAQGGCWEVALGFESGCEPILQSFNKRFDPQEVRRISQILGDYSVRRLGFLLLGGPGETKESVEQSLVFTDSLNLEVVKLTTGIRIYPHTPLARTAIEQGLISAKDDLLHPRFYLSEGLETWLPETVKSWMVDRPNWIT
jgi:radical SAM superfamily enzyme YgiQ (UPF0313 family)